METITRRGAVAALLLTLSAPLGAQVTGIVVRPQEPHDSVELRAMLMTKARLDSISALMRAFNNLPPGSDDWVTMRARIDALMPRLAGGQFFVRTVGPGSALPKGWIGINAEGPNFKTVGPDGYFVQYFDYPSIVSVDPESPAQKAGIAPGDVLIGYDGIDVRGHRFNLTQMLVPDKKLSVSIRHDGDIKDYTVTVAPAPAQVAIRRDFSEKGEIRVDRVTVSGDQPRGMVLEPSRPSVAVGGAGGIGGARAGAMPTVWRTFLLTPNGAFGAVMSTVKPELAKTLKLETGVLVTDVTDETPASRSGLRPGDVIVNVAGQPVATFKALQEILIMNRANPDRAITFQVVRDKRPQKITVSW